MKVLDNLKYPLFGEEFSVILEAHHYDNGRLALSLISEMEDEPGLYEPFATLTLNFPDEQCPEGEVWIKNYSELEGCVNWMIANDLIEAGATDNTQTGHIQVERFKLSQKLLSAIADALVREGERSRR